MGSSRRIEGANEYCEKLEEFARYFESFQKTDRKKVNIHAIIDRKGRLLCLGSCLSNTNTQLRTCLSMWLCMYVYLSIYLSCFRSTESVYIAGSQSQASSLVGTHGQSAFSSSVTSFCCCVLKVILTSAAVVLSRLFVMRVLL